MGVDLLAYRPWRGEFHSPAASVWPIARVSLWMIFRRKLFWALYALGLMIFLLFFFGQYMLAWAEDQLGESSVTFMGGRVPPDQLVNLFREALKLNGRGENYWTFFHYQGWMVMAVLALAGSILVGNDVQYGSLPFYLSKPLSRSHYVLGKCLAVAVFVNLMTTLPAAVLWVQYGLVNTRYSAWGYYTQYFELLAGILGYGLVLTVSLSLLLVATATWVRRTVPMVMTWTTLFVFCRVLSEALVFVLGFDRHWRLIDVWNDAGVVGLRLLGVEPPGTQPDVFPAALVLTAVSCVCLTYLILRIRAVEVVR